MGAMYAAIDVVINGMIEMTPLEKLNSSSPIPSSTLAPTTTPVLSSTTEPTTTIAPTRTLASRKKVKHMAIKKVPLWLPKRALIVIPIVMPKSICSIKGHSGSNL